MTVAWRTLFGGIVIGAFVGVSITNMSALHRAGRLRKTIVDVSTSYNAIQVRSQPRIGAAPPAVPARRTHSPHRRRRLDARGAGGGHEDRSYISFVRRAGQPTRAIGETTD